MAVGSDPVYGGSAFSKARQPLSCSDASVTSPENNKTIDLTQHALSLHSDLRFRELIRDHHWQAAEDSLRSLPDNLAEKVAEQVLNYRDSPQGLTTFQVMCIEGAPLSLVELSFMRGADLNAVGVRKTLQKSQLSNGTALHFAIASGNRDLAAYLAKCARGNFPLNLDGENALHTLYRDARSAVEREVANEILAQGVSINQPNKEGDTCLAKVVRSNNREEVLFLVQKGAAVFSLDEPSRKFVIGVLQRGLPELAMSKSPTKWLEMSVLLDWIERHRDEHLGEELTQQILNYRRSEGQFTLLHAMACYGASPELIKKAIKLGADKNAFATMDSDAYGRIERCTALHLALRSQCFAIASTLIDEGADVNIKDSQGNNAFHCLYHSRRPLVNKQIIAKLIEKRCNERLINARGETFLSLALGCEDAATVFTMTSELERRRFSPAGEIAKINTLADACLEQKAKRYLPQMVDILGQKQRPEDALLYIQAIAEAKNPPAAHVDSSFYKLLPDLLYTYKPGSASELVKLIGRLYLRGDFQKLKKFYHPNESELLALLAHPQASQAVEVHTNPIVATLKSLGGISEFDDVEISERRIKNWGRIGVLSYCYDQWRHDTYPVMDAAGVFETEEGRPPQAVKRSLLEQYGFFRLRGANQGREARHEKRFVLRRMRSGMVYLQRTDDDLRFPNKLDDSTYIEFCDTHILASHYEHGKLVIRNSTSENAMGVFEHTAYWSNKHSNFENQFEGHELSRLSPSFIVKHFSPILSLAANKREVEADEHLEFLLNHIEGVREDYFAFKFDTRRDLAIERIGPQTVIRGGFNSSGYKHLIEYLDRLLKIAEGSSSSAANRTSFGFSECITKIELAFVPREGIPQYLYPFPGVDGRYEKRIKVTPAVVDALRGLAQNNCGRDDLEYLGLKDFIQKAGFDKEGLLVVMVSTK